MKLQGVIPPTFTIFREDGELDLERTRAHLRFVIERGVHGVFVLGTNGEMPLLTFEERLKVIDAAVEEVAGRVPLIVGVGCPGTKETVALARHAEQAGADAIAVITPYFFPVPTRGIVQHYQSIAEAVDLPILVYHNPQFAGCRLSFEALQQLSEIPNVQGIKDSSGDISWISRIRRAFPHWSVLHGIDALIYPCLVLGVDGSVSGVANAFPEPVVALYEAVRRGDHEQAQSLQRQVAVLEEIAYEGPFLAGIKAALAWRGFPAGDPRPPLVSLSAAERERLEKRLNGLDIQLS